MRTDGPIRAAATGRKALDAAAVRAAVLRPDGLWRAVDVTEVTGSTNADLLALASGGAPEGVVLVAEQQRAGRGRMGRAWVAPPRAALTFSLLLRPTAAAKIRHGWLPLLAGLATAEAVGAVTPVDARLKWPNDVLAGPAKLGGILTEAAWGAGAAAGAVVVGIGLNVSTEPDELPPPGPGPAGSLAATSLRIAAPPGPDRGVLLAAILTGFERSYRAWTRAFGDAERSGLRAGYTRRCTTIGRQVRVELPGARLLTGLATGIDRDGRLLVRTGTGAELPVAAGDVVHLR
jgi:BirA family transcriptional regulator, biotin operon repressor / biotin---[acetyl-CoA-carboxylase] ligase